MSDVLTLPIRITLLDTTVLLEIAPDSPKGVTVAVEVDGETWKPTPAEPQADGHP